jgi:hypothetical protein
MVTLQLRQIVVNPGQCIELQEVDGAEFEAILEELSEKRAARIVYCDRHPLQTVLQPDFC